LITTMTKQITLEEALKLVAFAKSTSGEWQIKHILGDVYGEVWGDVCGEVWGNVYGIEALNKLEDH